MNFHNANAPIQDFWDDRDERFGEAAFDPLTMLPRTDEEAVIALRYGKTKEVGDSMASLFAIRRELGDSLTRACEAALLAFVSPGTEPIST